jgi:hypothetical protein
VVPEHLREPLEQMGARITPEEGTNATHIYVPGANHEYRIDYVPHSAAPYLVQHRHIGNSKWKTSAANTWDASHLPSANRLLNKMSRGVVFHQGPYHNLNLFQERDHTGKLHRSGELLYNNPNSDRSEEYPVGEGEPGTFNDEASLVHSAFNSRPDHTPLLALTDLLSEKHGIDLPLHDHPQQYARSLQQHYEQQQEEMI